MIDLNDVNIVEVSTDGVTVWVNVDGECKLRITGFKNLIILPEEPLIIKGIYEQG